MAANKSPKHDHLIESLIAAQSGFEVFRVMFGDTEKPGGGLAPAVTNLQTVIVNSRTS